MNYYTYMDYREILIGILTVLILSIVLGLLAGSIGSIAGFIIASIMIGYRVNRDISNGAIYASISCLLAGVIFTLAMLIMSTISHVGPGTDMMEFGFTGIIIGLMVNAVIGAICGAIGAEL
ncbi:MAG: hypothetical protein Kow0019_12140 [Methanobacteriaceae archaeon]